MRKELICFINNEGVLTAFRSFNHLGDFDITALKSVDDIKAFFRIKDLSYEYFEHEPIQDLKGINEYYLSMSNSSAYIYERNIYIINKSDRGCKLAFKGRYLANDEKFGYTISNSINQGDETELFLYCGANKDSHYGLYVKNLNLTTYLAYEKII